MYLKTPIILNKWNHHVKYNAHPPKLTKCRFELMWLHPAVLSTITDILHHAPISFHSRSAFLSIITDILHLAPIFSQAVLRNCISSVPASTGIVPPLSYYCATHYSNRPEAKSSEGGDHVCAIFPPAPPCAIFLVFCALRGLIWGVLRWFLTCLGIKCVLIFLRQKRGSC